MVTLEQARSIILKKPFTPKKIRTSIYEALNYYLAEDIRADRDYPPFNRAAVDGYAVNAKDVKAGIPSFEIAATVYPGEHCNIKPKTGICIKIMTGAAVPDGFNVLYKKEDCSFLQDKVIIPNQKNGPQKTQAVLGLNISKRGENAKRNALVLKKGSRIDERIVHTLAAFGIKSVPVFSAPVVNIVTTGDEIIPLEAKPSATQIRGSNYLGLLYHLKKYNIPVKSHVQAADDRKKLKAVLRQAINCDLFIISGGVSMGDKDFVPEVLEEFGVKKEFHKVHIKPGKPLWFGRKLSAAKKLTTVFALPGNPYATLVAFKIFLEPWLMASYGKKPPATYSLPIAGKRQLKGDRPEFFPVQVLTEAGKPSRLLPLNFWGSGDITATVGSDGLALHNPDEKSGGKKTLNPGDLLEFIPWNS